MRGSDSPSLLPPPISLLMKHSPASGDASDNTANGGDGGLEGVVGRDGDRGGGGGGEKNRSLLGF